jgi:hypothetical protein
LRQLLNDSTTKLPELETGKFELIFLFDFKSSFFKGISNLRLERDEILTTMNDKKQRHRSFTIQPKPLDPPVKFFVTLEQDT